MGLFDSFNSIVDQVFGKGFQNLSAALDFLGFDKPKKKKIAKTKDTAAKDKRIVTLRDIIKRNSRTALIVGSPKGVLGNEDPSAISARGRILGN